MKLTGREDRRDRSWRYADRARRVHLRVAHRYSDLDCICELSRWFFEKRKSMGCGCRRSPRGRPKVGGGLCSGCSYHECVVERIAGKRLCAGWLRWAGDRDDCEE